MISGGKRIGLADICLQAYDQRDIVIRAQRKEDRDAEKEREKNLLLASMSSRLDSFEEKVDQIDFLKTRIKQLEKENRLQREALLNTGVSRAELRQVTMQVQEIQDDMYDLQEKMEHNGKQSFTELKGMEDDLKQKLDTKDFRTLLSPIEQRIRSLGFALKRLKTMEEMRDDTGQDASGLAECFIPETSPYRIGKAKCISCARPIELSRIETTSKKLVEAELKRTGRSWTSHHPNGHLGKKTINPRVEFSHSQVHLRPAKQDTRPSTAPELSESAKHSRGIPNSNSSATNCNRDLSHDFCTANAEKADCLKLSTSTQSTRTTTPRTPKGNQKKDFDIHKYKANGGRSMPRQPSKKGATVFPSGTHWILDGVTEQSKVDVQIYGIDGNVYCGKVPTNLLKENKISANNGEHNSDYFHPSVPVHDNIKHFNTLKEKYVADITESLRHTFPLIRVCDPTRAYGGQTKVTRHKTRLPLPVPWPKKIENEKQKICYIGADGKCYFEGSTPEDNKVKK